MSKTCIAIVAVAVSLAYAGAALAQEQITTRDGSFYRGEVVEKVVGDHITIKTIAGELKRIEWVDLAPPSAPPPVIPAPMPPQPQAAPQVQVSVSANKEGANLQVLRETGAIDVNAWSKIGGGTLNVNLFAPVCTAPCTAMVDPRERYRVGGEGFTPTAMFSLTDPSNLVDASMRPTGRRTAGRVLTIFVGPPLVALGALALAVGALDSGKVACDGCVNFRASGLLWGGILGGLGIASLTTGIVLWATSRSAVSVNGVSAGLRLHGDAVLTADGVHF